MDFNPSINESDTQDYSHNRVIDDPQAHLKQSQLNRQDTFDKL